MSNKRGETMGREGLMGEHENGVHNFINAFDLVPRALGNGAGVKLFGVRALAIPSRPIS